MLLLSAPSPRLRQLSHVQALWLNGAILVSFLAASSAPSPLYAIYREAWGFSALTLTIVFASYAFAMLAALLVFGSLSDHRGRRQVVLGALAIEFASLLLFCDAQTVECLLAARILQGVATGVATSTIGTGLIDLHRERGALINAVAPMIGIGTGALGTSLLVQFAPAPTTLVFDVLLVVFALLALAAFYLPETVACRPGAWRSLRPNITIPAQARQTMWQVLPVNTAPWALGGFYMSLGPTLARLVTGNAAPVVGGASIAALVLSSAAALAVGVGITLIGVQLHSTAAFFAGTVVAGLGFGAAFNGSMRSLWCRWPRRTRLTLMAMTVAALLAMARHPARASTLFTFLQDKLSRPHLAHRSVSGT